MEIAIAGSTLPCSTLCHVVCALVATGITGTNDTSSVPVATQMPPQQVESLPEGYIAHSDIGVAYKVYNEHVNLTEARKRCIRNGARLAVIDSAKKLQYVKNQRNADATAHVGIVRRYNTFWVDDTTGEELGTLPWQTGYPTGNFDCVRMRFADLGLFNHDCASSWNYVCEIPIIVFRDNTMTVN